MKTSYHLQDLYYFYSVIMLDTMLDNAAVISITHIVRHSRGQGAGWCESEEPPTGWCKVGIKVTGKLKRRRREQNVTRSLHRTSSSTDSLIKLFKQCTWCTMNLGNSGENLEAFSLFATHSDDLPPIKESNRAFALQTLRFFLAPLERLSNSYLEQVRYVNLRA